MAELLQDMLVNISQTFTCGNILHSLKEELKNNLKGVQTNTEAVRVSGTDIEKPERFSDCSELLRHGHVTSGVYTVQPETFWRPLRVYCDMTTAVEGGLFFREDKTALKTLTGYGWTISLDSVIWMAISGWEMSLCTD